MNFFGKPKGKRYHTRTTEISTYEYDEQRFVVEGCLADHRWQEFHLETGEKRRPGIFHHMIIHWLVNKQTLLIEDIDVTMPAVPDDGCLEIIGSIEPVKGLSVARGFTSKVKALGGNGKGCTHIIELLISMAGSAVQGYVAYRQHESLMSKTDIMNMCENTCWTWRSDGPVVSLLKEKIKEERDGH